MLMNKSDEELMVAYQMGDENAFRELYSRHSGRVLGFLRAKTGEAVRADDIFQAVFLKLHKSRGQYNARLPFAPWLFTICRSELLDTWKKGIRLREDPVADLSDFPDSRLATAGEKVDLTALNESQRRAVSMRYTENFSFEEIALAMETSPSNVRQLVSRALKTLRRLYGKE